MNWWRRLTELNSPRPRESRRDFLARMRDSKGKGYVPKQVYAELVELHDRIDRIEAESARGMQGGGEL